MTTPLRQAMLMAEHLERFWPVIAKWFRERNWPDTELGRAAACINSDVDEIIATLRGQRGVASSESEAIVAMRAELEQERDIRSTREITLSLVADGLGVEHEPHQTFDERLLEASCTPKALALLKEARPYLDLISPSVSKNRPVVMVQTHCDTEALAKRIDAFIGEQA